MKIVLYLHMILLLVCFCSQCKRKDEIKEQFTGIYIRFSQHEYGTEYDTLVISHQPKTPGGFIIVRKWNYQRILDGKLLEPEYKKELFHVDFDAAENTLKEPVSGLNYRLDTKTKTLYVGTTAYQKIK
jgi:hypothetical protein